MQGTYDLPFGKGRMLLGNANPWVDGILGGWSLAGTYSYHSGAPLGLPDWVYLGNDLKWDGHKKSGVFDTTQINTDPKAQFQSHFRTSPSQQSKYRVDATNNVDFTLSKMFHVKEMANLQFRAEGFNLFNRPQFSGPVTSATDKGFGNITKAPTNQTRVLQFGLRLLF
jgi:hypothetical protein